MAANSLTYQFKTASIVTKLIVINAALYLLFRLVPFFMGIEQVEMARWFVLPNALSEISVQPWSFITYAFVHFDFFHVLFNMLWLYWFGGYIMNLFDAKRFLTIYLLGAITGGLLYVVSYNLLPVFENSGSYLIGASGAVMAIVFFIATYTPNTQIRIIFFTAKLWQIAVFLILFDLVRLPVSGNAGGLLAHVGGAIFGYLYAQQLSKGNDIGRWFTNFISWFDDLFKPRTKKPFRKVHRTQASSQKNTLKDEKSEYQKKVDTILDKIGKSGYDSLTSAEKDFLFKAGKDD